MSSDEIWQLAVIANLISISYSLYKIANFIDRRFK